MSHPQLHRRYEATAARPAVEFHLEGCACVDCEACRLLPPVPPVPPALPIGWLTLAAIVFGNAIAFAFDPAASWATLSTAVRHLLGVR